MAFHHVALATRDLRATHAFYTDAMGFDLVRVEAIPTMGGGWARHAFYDTGDGMIAFWDLHGDAEVPDDFSPAISTGLGLPEWVNHLAFTATNRASLDAAIDRWLDTGRDVLEIDHGWCTSIYTTDPNGILVEWCTTTRAFDDTDRREAARLLLAEHPEIDPTEPEMTVHKVSARSTAPA
jgi:catechol 2,3-dioxygenase-like lactoylglutathione lyase family enzyme